MSKWSLIFNHYNPKEEPLREALTALGNGYFMTRGAAEESCADETHYPGTYLAGGYNRLISVVGGHSVSNEDLVNWPNWIHITFSIEDQPWFNLNAVHIIDYHHELNLKEGCLYRRIRFQDHSGRESTLQSRRLVHMRQPHLGAIEYQLTAHNWSGSTKLRSSLDGSVVNAGVARYQGLNSKHHNVMAKGELKNHLMYLIVETNQSHIRLSQVIRHQLFINNSMLDIPPNLSEDKEKITHEFKVFLQQGQSVKLEKIMALYTSRDRAISGGLNEAHMICEQAGSFDDLLVTHGSSLQFLWNRCDIKIEGDSHEQLLLRLFIFHLLQTVSLNSIQNHVGVPARGLHGEAYRGHIFWDELFIFPFYTYHFPLITRSLLLYRYERLPIARYLAHQSGLNGAMFPWQSGSNGEDETPSLHLNPRSNQWGPDLSHYQRHINAAIVYNVWQYYCMTKDDEFLNLYGAEMILDIARFFGSITRFCSEKKRYVINNVVGPDEYHEQYPDSTEHGLNNNAYTNIMAVWVLETALNLFNYLPPLRKEELCTTLKITSEELKDWRRITRNMFIPFHDDTILSQFEGYDDLLEFPWETYEAKYGNLERLDRILKAEGDSTNRYKLSKQPDALMLFYLFDETTLRQIFNKLGYPEFNHDAILRTIDYYKKRTSHGSSLSKVIIAKELGYINIEQARPLVNEAMLFDLKSETTHEGIHLGAMAGILNIFQHQYAGIQMTQHISTKKQHFKVHLRPCLPNGINRLSLRYQHQNNWYTLSITSKQLTIMYEWGHARQATVYVNDKLIRLKKNQPVSVNF